MRGTLKCPAPALFTISHMDYSGIELGPEQREIGDYAPELKISSVHATTNHDVSELSGNQETNKKISVGFEVLTPVVMMSSISWDICRVVCLKPADISEEHVASIFTVVE
jgi:hypothetical protein